MSRQELLRSDAELTAFYTSSLGVSAQPYESTGGSSGPGDFDRGIVRELDDAAMNDRATRTRAFDAVRATLARTTFDVRHVLAEVYTPRGTTFSASERQIAKTKSKDGDVVPDFLAIALTPRWGGGSFVRLALTQARTVKAYAKIFPDRSTDAASLLAFLAFEAGLGVERASFFRQLREDCEMPRTRALEAYNALRSERIDAEAAERRRRRETAAKASAALFEQTLEAKSHRARSRLAKLRDLDAIELAAEIYAGGVIA